MTEAERRAEAIRSRRRTSSDVSRSERPEPAAPREALTWIDEGPLVDDEAARLRSAARDAVGRAEAGSTGRRPVRLDPAIADAVSDQVGATESAKLIERLAVAADALERDRLDEARRIAQQLARRSPDVAAVQELLGLANYRLGRWREAVDALERSQELRETVETLPVLADCHRALGHHRRVAEIWEAVKRSSPRHEIMAEARIVMAGSLADRGEVREAIALLSPSTQRVKRVRVHHLRQWYALADLYDRAGDVVSARRWFSEVAAFDAEFVDVRERLRALGR